VLAWVAATAILACSLMQALGDRGVRATRAVHGYVARDVSVQMFLDGVAQFWAGLAGR
jgi:small neutral amino acid transporter SnatA (MarC family)